MLVLKKLGHVGIVLLLVTVATLKMVDLSPGDPAYELLGDQATPDQVAAVHHELGLDRPFLERYGHWLKHAATGDLGRSPITNQSVSSALTSRLPVTIELAVMSLVLALLVALPLGVYTAYRSEG